MNEQIKKLSEQNLKFVDTQALTQASLDDLAKAESELSKSDKKETEGLSEEAANQVLGDKAEQNMKELEKENAAIEAHTDENIEKINEKVDELEVEKINELTEKQLEAMKKAERLDKQSTSSRSSSAKATKDKEKPTSLIKRNPKASTMDKSKSLTISQRNR